MRAAGGVAELRCTPVFMKRFLLVLSIVALLAPAIAASAADDSKVKGRGDVRVIAQGGDGGTTDIGFGCLSGMFERNDDVLYICYDNEAYMADQNIADFGLLE